MKLRQTMAWTGACVGALCVLVLVGLWVNTRNAARARQAYRELRCVDDGLHGVALQLLEYGLPGAATRDEEALEAAYRLARDEVEECVVHEGWCDVDLVAFAAALDAYRAWFALGAERDARAVAALRAEMLASLRALRDRVDAELDRAEGRVALAQERVALLAGVVALLLLGLGFGLVGRVSRRVLGPTHDLKRAMQELDDGRWPAEVKVSLNDELGELAATFNSMAVGKRETEEELRAMKAELEQRVVARTSALAQAIQALELEVDERRRAEERLRLSEERFRRIFEEGPIGIALVDRQNRMLTANPAMAAILDRPFEDLVGVPVTVFLAGEHPEQEVEQARAAFRGGAEAYSKETRIARPDGEPRLVRLVAAAVRGEREAVDYGVLMVEDVTERKRTEELLIENERFVATGRMAARIAHEINNPLAAIKNAFRLVRTAISEDHAYYRYVPSIDREIDRVARIVRQMYEIYRPPAESLEEFRADEAVRDVVELLRVGAAPGASEILLDVSRATSRVTLQEGLLRQVLYNLIQNAVEHSPDGTPVRVVASTAGEALEITVADEGEGIPPANAGRVFEAFFTTKEGREGSGLGLGLSITLRAVEALGGTLTFDSEVGVGTTFRVRLPLTGCAVVAAT